MDFAWTYIGVEPGFLNGEYFPVCRSSVTSRKSVLGRFACIVMLRPSALNTAIISFLSLSNLRADWLLIAVSPSSQ